MQALKRTIATLGILLLSLPITYVANAESTKDTLHSAKEQLEQSNQTILQKEKEQQAVHEEVKSIKENVKALENEITQNQQSLAQVEGKIEEIQQLIQQKKEEIVLLQDKVYAREGIMEKRLVALQHSDHTTIVIETLINSESVGNFFERIGAVATLLNADKEILDEQEADLKQIEEDKKEIDKQEQLLISQQADIEGKKAKLEGNIAKRNQALVAMQDKYTKLSSEISLAEKEKNNIQSQINTIQSEIKKEAAAAKARAVDLATKKAKEADVVQAVAPPTSNKNSSTSGNSESSKSGKEMYVTATAYSHEDTKSDVTYLGYNIKTNPNMKLIAVDPGVIPLGSKVWVEDYGVAIAGDTGGAIIGHKIDVLMPSSARAKQWGRQTVKIIILD
ncbi:MAG: 3D domain-containing protein [Bacillota bacterium]